MKRSVIFYDRFFVLTVLIIVCTFLVLSFVSCDSKPEIYTVTFDGCKPDGIVADVEDLPDPVHVTSGSTIGEQPTPKLYGYDFEGWYTSDNKKFNLYSTTVTEDTILYARWDKIMPVVIKLEGNRPDGATSEIIGLPTDPLNIDYGNTIGEIKPSLEGFIFEGWYVESSMQTKDKIFDTISEPVTKDLVLYAKWAYTAGNADELNTWAEAARKDPTTSCTLTNSIDLTGKNWNYPINNQNQFIGTFDGNGYTISGLTSETFGANTRGLFHQIGPEGEVRNLNLNKVVIKNGHSNLGGIAGINFGIIENCSVEECEINSNGGTNIGGIAGSSYGIISNCKFDGTLTGGSVVGGIIGVNNDNGYITECSSSGNISGNHSIGGIAGHISGPIDNCHAEANVKGQDEVGGIVGRASNDVTSCSSKGTVYGTVDYIGGVVGYGYIGASISDCYSESNVSGKAFVGGVVGANDGGITAGSYQFRGTVTGTGDDVGGVVGFNKNLVYACYSSGDVTGCNNVGGVSGRSQSIITSCYSIGNVKGDVQVNRIVGLNEKNSENIECYSNAVLYEGNQISYFSEPYDWSEKINPMNSALSDKGWQYIENKGEDNEVRPIILEKLN